MFCLDCSVTEKDHGNVTHGNLCPSRDMKQALPEYNSRPLKPTCTFLLMRNYNAETYDPRARTILVLLSTLTLDCPSSKSVTR